MQQIFYVCCSGYNWEPIEVLPSSSIVGICGNPNCPIEKGTEWQGVSIVCEEDMANEIEKGVIL